MPESMELLAGGALELGIKLTDRQLAQFETYYRELHQWNQRVNLTAITEYSEVQVKHFLDSLTCCLAFPEGLPAARKIVDIGAGAGFPGLPLKLVFPDFQLLLSDSVGKKTAFLRHLLQVLELPDVTVLTARAEQLGRAPETRERFDLVLARGVAKLPALLEYALPLCRIGGKIVAWKHGG
ncbi:MAG: 16S rRNA (guanine(527)-N(7))-methyltransferase RsmG, partial [Chloroflexi bacterium]|nr:16S rRNA (guanine(527)-N(7))-methyltransferase RsmG [Chloroflexota bacterium]